MEAAPAAAAAVAMPTDGDVVVTLNKIERYKKEKDGLDILDDVPQLAQGGWEAIEEGDRERLKWAGVFFRRQTPGPIHDARADVERRDQRRPDPHHRGDQPRVRAGFADITTRQQIQLRGFGIERGPGDLAIGSTRWDWCRSRPAWTTSATSPVVPRPA